MTQLHLRESMTIVMLPTLVKPEIKELGKRTTINKQTTKIDQIDRIDRIDRIVRIAEDVLTRRHSTFVQNHR